MIVPMKRLAVFVQAKDAKDAVGQLRSLGVVHIEHQSTPKGDDVNNVRRDYALYDDALAILSMEELQPEKTSSLPKPRLASDTKAVCHHIIDSWKRLQQLRDYAQTIKRQAEEWQPWGDFDPHVVTDLAKKNIFVRLYEVPVAEFKRLSQEQGVVVEEIFKGHGMVYCAVVLREDKKLAFKEISPPKMSLSKMRHRLEEDERAAERIKEDIEHKLCYRDEFMRLRTRLSKDLEFAEALAGMGDAGQILYATGYIPFDAVAKVEETARAKQWGIVIGDPSEEDAVPTYIRTPRWVSLVRPVFAMLEIIPGYRELDVSAMFLVFFSLFFGILIGDAGYGFVYLLLTWWWQRTHKAQSKNNVTIPLFYLLSLCAIVWGLLTGTFFGQGWCSAIGLRPLVPVLNDTHFMQTFCFFLGALHLSLAHSWRALLKMPSLTALVDVGWIAVLWSAFFLAKMLILGDSMPAFVVPMLYGGVALVILFTNPQKNILKGIGEGLGTVALSLMNNFTDVVSYIRLFAVGMATLAIAETANAIGASVGANTLLGVIITALILIVGHTLNIVLGPISVLVHGVRLNVLEFSGHVNVSWSGSAYKPLKE